MPVHIYKSSEANTRCVCVCVGQRKAWVVHESWQMCPGWQFLDCGEGNPSVRRILLSSHLRISPSFHWISCESVATTLFFPTYPPSLNILLVQCTSSISPYTPSMPSSGPHPSGLMIKLLRCTSEHQLHNSQSWNVFALGLFGFFFYSVVEPASEAEKNGTYPFLCSHWRLLTQI